MNKRHLFFLLPTIILTQMVADNSPEYQEMMDAMDRVNQKQELLFERIKKNVVQVDEARDTSVIDLNTTPQETHHSKIVEANALGDIAQSVAKVEIAKIHVKDTLLQEVKTVDDAKAEGNLSKEAVEKMEAKAVSAMAQSLSALEQSKLDATQNIAESIKDVEISKTEPAKELVSPESALSVAKSVAASKVAQAVSAVEITQAVSDVEQASLVEPSVIPRKSLPEVEAEARAIIAQEVAKVEIAKANALAIIAKAVASVEIAKAQEEQESTLKMEKREIEKNLF